VERACRGQMSLIECCASLARAPAAEPGVMRIAGLDRAIMHRAAIDSVIVSCHPRKRAALFGAAPSTENFWTSEKVRHGRGAFSVDPAAEETTTDRKPPPEAESPAARTPMEPPSSASPSPGAPAGPRRRGYRIASASIRKDSPYNLAPYNLTGKAALPPERFFACARRRAAR
jgi:hypothetical protein